MAVIAKSINWDNAVWLQAVDAVATMNGYQATIPDPADQTGAATLPNPQSKQQFFNAWVKKQAINAITEKANRDALATVIPVTDTAV